VGQAVEPTETSGCSFYWLPQKLWITLALTHQVRFTARGDAGVVPRRFQTLSAGQPGAIFFSARN
jgi:hypothetical protein